MNENCFVNMLESSKFVLPSLSRSQTFRDFDTVLHRYSSQYLPLPRSPLSHKTSWSLNFNRTNHHLFTSRPASDITAEIFSNLRALQTQLCFQPIIRTEKVTQAPAEHPLTFPATIYSHFVLLVAGSHSFSTKNGGRFSFLYFFLFFSNHVKDCVIHLNGDFFYVFRKREKVLDIFCIFLFIF